MSYDTVIIDVISTAVCQAAAGEGRGERRGRRARGNPTGARGDAHRTHQGTQVQVSGLGGGEEDFLSHV